MRTPQVLAFAVDRTSGLPDAPTGRGGQAAFEPIRRYKVAATETWAQPAISGSRIVKDATSLTLWTWN